jgi:hypothetical protein
MSRRVWQQSGMISCAHDESGLVNEAMIRVMGLSELGRR